MNLKSLFFAALIAFTLTSCMTRSYYQVYKVTPDDNITLKENSLVYEDENCKVLYDLWGNGGNIGFAFQNKTDKNIYLNMEESFFIMNGTASNYYQNRVFSNTTSSGTSVSRGAHASRSMINQIAVSGFVGIMNASGKTVSYTEEKIVCIPAMSSKNIAEYSITQSLFRDCALLKYPKKNQIKTKSFTKANSPLIFSNRIVYAVGLLAKPVKLENEFYGAQITNFPEREVFETKADVFCGQKGTGKTRSFKNVAPDKFYINYIKGQDTWEH